MKHLFRRSLLLFVVSVVLMQLSVSAASNVRLNRTTKTLYTSGTVTLKVKGTSKKVSWSVSGKKLVSIKTKGTKKHTAVITAKQKTGSCYVVAKAGKKKLRCKITVKKKEKTSPAKEPAPTPAPKPVVPEYKEKDKAVLGIADASVKLFQKSLSKSRAGQNVMISPQSILTALSLVEYGAAGSTLKEIEGLMGGVPVEKTGSYLSSMSRRLGSDNDLICETSNSIWYRENMIKLKTAYLERMRTLFSAEDFEAPFDATTVRKINDWVSNKTKGKIKKIIDVLDASARVVLINTLYFKGMWSEQYYHTVKRTFTDEKGVQSSVPMLEGAVHSYVTMKGAEGFLKYYSGGAVAFLGLLPPSGQSVEAFVNSLTGEDFVNSVKSAKTSGILVHTRMPEFTVEYEVSLNEVLKELGVRTAFTDFADFSGMSDSPTMIDKVLHKTYIKLDKDGTEAAAVTAIVAKAASALKIDYEEKYIYLDRPFVYALIDSESGLPLFIGTVKTIK